MRFMTATLLATWAPRLLSVLRILAALLLLQFGTAKLLGFPSVNYLQEVRLFSLYGASGVLELVGGTLLALGLFTRGVAFVLSGEMALAYFIEHARHSFFPVVNDGTLAVLFCFVFLYLAAAGGGPWSVDALLARRSAAGPG
jgi:putative oxidoreductase